MASSVNLVLSTKTTSDKSESMSITDINPNATNQQIIDFVDKVMAFSTNSIDKISKVTREDVFRNG